MHIHNALTLFKNYPNKSVFTPLQINVHLKIDERAQKLALHFLYS
ncbi:hypothetical protein XBP1_1050008 [Xenorhabdus bovienii str. puntauvense]|uniref:Uncharacterized protein n=2 Tax=Xenorhabdus bovienii TaxID=40576 RepID=A0A0B6XC77_XENBV|nr:hypothetical protein XBP1_1050008 [Xenorhabdus bovienii str. puntauvense]CDM91462.1 protein of unknown function [Xenorhabdus bovienii]